MASQTYQPPQQALVVIADRILEVGLSEDLLAKYPTFYHIDANGQTIIPGFIDSHVHLAGQGKKMIEVQLHPAMSEEDCILITQKYVKDNDIQPNEWILGAGWDHSMFPNHQLPSKESLDKVFPNNPINFIDINYHASWANSAAMKLASIPATDPEGGEIERDENGEATGIFRETAMQFVDAVIPEYSTDDIREFYRVAINACRRYGLTGVHMAGEKQEDIEIIKELIEAGEFDLRAYLMLMGTDKENLERYCTGSIPDLQLVDFGDGRLTIRAIKIVMDGSLSPKGAAMIDNYIGEDHNGLMRMEPEEYIPLIQTWGECGYQICIHCIGNRCVRDILNAYEAEFLRHPSWRNNRWRIEHAEIVTAEDLPRFVELQVLPSVQPTHFPHHMRYVPSIVGEEVARFGLLGKSILKTGSLMPLGSDFPAVSEVDPLKGVFAAISRQMPDGTPQGGFQPEERLSIWEAIRGFTYHAAYAAHEENRVGTLETGKRADFIFLSENIIEKADEDFTIVQRTKVVATFFGGKCIMRDVSTGSDKYRTSHDAIVGGLCM